MKGRQENSKSVKEQDAVSVTRDACGGDGPRGRGGPPLPSLTSDITCSATVVKGYLSSHLARKDASL